MYIFRYTERERCNIVHTLFAAHMMAANEVKEATCKLYKYVLNKPFKPVVHDGSERGGEATGAAGLYVNG